MPHRRFTAADAKRFYDRFGARQDIQFYENAAIDRLIAHSDFAHASSVFELGCGTGRLAERLMRAQLPAKARYVGVDVSATMIGLTEHRLASWGDRVSVRLADGTGRWPEPDGASDRFVAAYVLDLLDESAIGDVLREAHRLLRPEGKLCTLALTEGRTPASRALCTAWKAVHALSPRLVGGCRPLAVERFLDPIAWRVDVQEVVSSWGICSEVLVAARV